jgi:hypothetical protein
MHQSRCSAATVSAVVLAGIIGTSQAALAADGQHPDFSGTWNLLQHDRPGGRFGAPAEPELTPAGKAKVEAFVQTYDVVTAEPGAYCVAGGMPTLMFGLGGYPMEFTQNAERLTIIAELESQFRRIFLDGRGHPKDYPGTRAGHSVGHWEREGDSEVLVIETALIKEWLVDRWPHSDQMRIVERMKMRRPGEIKLASDRVNAAELGDWVIENRITVTDPVMYSAPVTVTAYYRRVDEYTFLEYDCAEGNWRAVLDEQARQ